MELPYTVESECKSDLAAWEKEKDSSFKVKHRPSNSTLC